MVKIRVIRLNGEWVAVESEEGYVSTFDEASIVDWMQNASYLAGERPIRALSEITPNATIKFIPGVITVIGKSEGIMFVQC